VSLCEVDVIASLHRPDGALARVLIREATEHIVQEALAHRAIGDAHFLHTEHGENFRENRDSAGEDRATVFGNWCETQLANVPGVDHVRDGTLEARRGDCHCLRIELADRLTDGANGAGASGATLPPSTAKSSLYRLELQA